MKPKVLFVCIHNSARSQMAEAFLKRVGGERFDVYSAGIEGGSLNPYVVAAMKEVGFDLASNATKKVSDPNICGQQYEYVVTVCDEAAAERCPIFPTKGTRLHWSFADPSTFTGSREEIIARVREVRDEIASRIDEWYALLGPVARA